MCIFQVDTPLFRWYTLCVDVQVKLHEDWLQSGMTSLKALLSENLFVWRQWKLQDLDRLDEVQCSFSEERVCR